MGGVQYAPIGGFRALKKTTEAPYTTKVDYRERTSRGTTLCLSAAHVLERKVSGSFSRRTPWDVHTQHASASIIFFWVGGVSVARSLREGIHWRPTVKGV